MKIKNRKRLGSGAHWVVDRVELSDEVMINGIIYKTVIIKTQKNSSADIDENIKTYSFVKKAQLPTLTFYEKDTIDEKDCIIAEDLNLGSIIYVSPNTARNIPDQTKLLLNLLMNKSDDISIFENEMMNNKISIIDNFDCIYSKLMCDMETATKNGLGMCEDAFFFGIKKEQLITIDYKIADFDTIITHDIPYSGEIVKRNQITALNSLLEFLMYFHEENQNKKEYDSKLNRKINLLRQEIGKV